MRIDVQHLVHFELGFILTGLLWQFVRAKDYYDYQDYYQNYGETGGDYYGGDGGKVSKRKQEYEPVYADSTEVFHCYACHYEVDGKDNTGTANCDDPFNSYGIETVPCYTFCGKFRKQLDDSDLNSYSLTRICLPKCKDHENGLEYTECCSKDKCNGAVPSKSVTYSFTLLTFVCSFTVSLFLQS